MTQIHRTALVDARAELGRNVVVGPFCVVEAGAVIGDDCTLAAGVVVKSGTTLGCHNTIAERAILGGRAQDPAVAESGGAVTIGDHNTIRENVTIDRGWTSGASTVIQNNNLLMVGSQVGHDCQVGSHCILVNHVRLGGFVRLDDGAYLGGAATVAERCRIGRLAMIGAMTPIVKDVPPYVMIVDAEVVGLNRVGLARHGYTTQETQQVKAAYRVIYRKGLQWNEVLALLKSDFQEGPAAEFGDFLRSGVVPEGESPEERQVAPGSAVAFD
jgi:UDP-N-acetylglucosamine acyltransferase